MEFLKDLGGYHKAARKPPCQEHDHNNCTVRLFACTWTCKDVGARDDLMQGTHMVGWISATQAPISVPTVEAESFAVTRTVFDVIGFMSVAEDFDRSLNCELVGYGTAERWQYLAPGCPYRFHDRTLDVSSLWREQEGENPATLNLDTKKHEKHVVALGFNVVVDIAYKVEKRAKVAYCKESGANWA